MKYKLIESIVLLVAFGLVTANNASSEQLLVDPNNVRALIADGDLEETPFIRIFYNISSVFKVPISYEAPFPNEERSLPTANYQIRRNQTLAFSIDDFVARSEGKLKYKLVRNVPLIYPANESGRPNIFDGSVSLNLSQVSVWEAFKALGKEINKNAQEANHSGVRVIVECVVAGKKPPEILLSERSISLELVNVSAREAACAIIAKTPRQISFRYSHGNDSNPIEFDRLFLLIREDGENWDEGKLSREENDFWIQESEDSQRP